MTELSAPEPHDAAQQPLGWPAPASPVADSAVAAALAALAEIPAQPVAQQQETYALLHDELLAALNAEPASVQPASTPPTNFPHPSAAEVTATAHEGTI